MKIHLLPQLDQGDAYDYTQCADGVKDGDIIACRDGVAVMVQAWPVHVVGETVYGFHTLDAGVTLDKIDGGKYAEAARIAGMFVLV